MVKNTSGGNKTKKKKRIRVVDIYNAENNGQYFGKIVRNMGGHFAVIGVDNVERIGKLRNTMKRGPRINKDSYVIYSLREFSDNNECDIIGIANPPQNIIRQFDNLDPKKKVTDIEFNNSDDEFSNIDKTDTTEIKDDVNKSYYDLNMLPENNDEEYYEKTIESNYEECKNLMSADIENIDFFGNDESDNEIEREPVDDEKHEADMIEDMMDLNKNSIKTSKSKSKKKKQEEELENMCDELNNIDFDNINFDDI
jgi:translation initiation factor IF-1